MTAYRLVANQLEIEFSYHKNIQTYEHTIR